MVLAYTEDEECSSLDQPSSTLSSVVFTVFCLLVQLVTGLLGVLSSCCTCYVVLAPWLYTSTPVSVSSHKSLLRNYLVHGWNTRAGAKTCPENPETVY